MKKKYLNLFTVLFVTLFIGMMNPSALITGGAASSAGVGGGSGGGNFEGEWNNGQYEGIRLTLVDKDGKRISGTQSIDFRSEKSLANPIAYFNTDITHNSKKELWNSNGEASFNVQSVTVNAPDLGDFVNDTDFSFPRYQGEYITNINGSGSDYFYNLFYNMSYNNRQGFMQILNAMTISGNYEAHVKNRDVCGSLKDGYLIIEPTTMITIRGEQYILTASEAILMARQLNSQNLYNSAGFRYNMYFAIFVDNRVSSLAGFSQVQTIINGLSCPNFDNCEAPTVDEFNRNKTFGYSVGVFKFADLYDEIPCTTTCYSITSTCNETKCDNTNKNNNRTCETKTSSYECSYEQYDEGIHASGEQKIKLIDGVCSLYCTEEATVYYPGNVSPAITLGTNFTWPTKTTGLYPLKTSAKLKCKVEMNDGSAVTQACLNAAANRTYQYDNGNEVAQLIYNDTSKDKEIPLQQHCMSGSSVNGDSVTITNSCYYTLPNGEKSLISKETVKFVNKVAVEATAATSNYILTKYHGVLPIGGYHWTDEGEFSKEMFANSYKLEITNLPLGFNGEFTSKLNSTPYVCNYKVTKGIKGVVYPCLCPPGTPNDGLDLYSYIKDNTMTCTDAQHTYCDKSDINLACPLDSDKPGERPAEFVTCMDTYDYNYCVQENCYITPPDSFCIRKTDNVKVILTDCLKTKDWLTCEQEAGCTETPPGACPPGSAHPERNCVEYVANGGTEAQCIAEWCNDPSCIGDNCEYICPKDSDYYPMDISSCVGGQRGAGKTLQDALNYCYKDCYKSGFGIAGSGTIIYRTISLENPFPSMNGDKTISQTGLSIGMFNDTVRGRYPGTNWKSVDLVRDKILNNRGYDGSAIYQEAEPLYVIELDAKAIQEIRKYNKEQMKQDNGYADFTLTCTNGAYCRSNKFLRSSRFTTATNKPILSGGTCQSVDSKKSFISCYTTQ